MTTETNDAPVPSGLRVREILVERKMIDGKLVITPALDEQGQEIEVYSIPVPQHIEAEGAEAIEAHVAELKTRLNLSAPELVPDTPPDPASAPEAVAPHPDGDS
jgi:hypothetical protein